jgi:hypothetical protein
MPFKTGTSAAIAALLAFPLSPNNFKCSILGPIKVIPDASQRSAKSALSDRNP